MITQSSGRPWLRPPCRWLALVGSRTEGYSGGMHNDRVPTRADLLQDLLVQPRHPMGLLGHPQRYPQEQVTPVLFYSQSYPQE